MHYALQVRKMRMFGRIWEIWLFTKKTSMEQMHDLLPLNNSFFYSTEDYLHKRIMAFSISALSLHESAINIQTPPPQKEKLWENKCKFIQYKLFLH
jgi:hypothetical protein